MKTHDATELAYKRGYQDGREDALCLRSCLADGKPATFHRWVEEDRALLQIDVLLKPEEVVQFRRAFDAIGTAPSGSRIEMLRTCFALVEYPDGSVGKVKPELITFLDRREG